MPPQSLLRRLSTLTLLLCLTACGDDDATFDGGPNDGGATDSNVDAAIDPCADVPVEDLCTETQCDGTTLVSCEADATGCLVRRAVDCASTGSVCDAESLSCQGGECVPECSAAGARCDGDGLRTCSADATGCLRLERETCALGCTSEPAPACVVSDSCPALLDIARPITCGSVIADTTVRGTAHFDTYCDGSTEYRGQEQLFVFTDPNVARATIMVQTVFGSEDMDLFVLEESSTCEMSTCVTRSVSTSGDEEVTFDSMPGDTHLVAYDVYDDDGSAGGAVTYSLRVECELSECGDSTVAGVEGCDDGNTSDGDGCSSLCAVEEGYFCEDGTDCRLSCGDGDINGDDACDDGGTADGDGCSASCSIEAGYVCDNSGDVSVCALSCGNGTRDGDDECDDGGTADGDGCSASCELEAGFYCFGNSPTRCAVEFGRDEGILENTDDAWTRPNESCEASTTGTVFDTFPYTNTTSLTQYVSVIAEFDFDGYLFVFDAAPNGADPLNACRVGDDDFDGTNGARIRAVAVPAGETIHVVISSYDDDGRGEYSFSMYDAGFVCGDGIVSTFYGENCDDDNRTEGDGCSSACRTESGYVCGGEPSVCRPIVCGDGVIEGDEVCDDGNAMTGDGCTSCETDDGFFCSGEPSSCVVEVCGNSIIEAREICDDGNVVSGDGCESDCFSAVFSGSLTAGDPIWARPDQDCMDSYAGRHYDVLPFEWEGAGDVELLWSVDWDGVDGHLHVYDGFDASTPSEGCLSGNDDRGAARSAVVQSIGSGETQQALISTFNAGDTGEWTLTISR